MPHPFRGVSYVEARENIFGVFDEDPCTLEVRGRFEAGNLDGPADADRIADRHDYEGLRGPGYGQSEFDRRMRQVAVIAARAFQRDMVAERRCERPGPGAGSDYQRGEGQRRSIHEVDGVAIETHGILRMKSPALRDTVFHSTPAN